MLKNYISGKWLTTNDAIAVKNPYNNEVIDEVPAATEEDAVLAIDAAMNGVKQAKMMGAHKRYLAMLKAADLLDERQEEFAQIITAENGKPITEARTEVARSVDVIRMSAFEGAMVRGEQMPFEAAVNGADTMGMTIRVPCGVVVAITPFNFPLMLALHKVGPALTTGNAIVLKPASVTPLSAIKLTELFHEAGFEGDMIQVITGSGSKVGNALVKDPRPRKVSFTGSSSVGKKITEMAGIKKLSLELGSNSPMVVLPDANIEDVASHISIGGYANAGQVCISLQRVIVDQQVYADLLDAAKEKVEDIKVGEPLNDDTKLAAMIEEKEATRVETWVDEAVKDGAKLVTGGSRENSVYSPTIIADAKPNMKVVCNEVFGPVVAVTPVKDVDDAISHANDTDYGLSAAIFTSNIANAMKFARDCESGNIQVNWSPQWRADFMPYGGLKGSGIGKEGPRSTCLEMTEEKTIAIHGIPPFAN